MTGPRVYFIGQQIVVEWSLRDLAGDPVTEATITGEVAAPDGQTTPMVITEIGGGVYRAVHVATQPGTHVYRLTAAGTAQDAAQGTVVVGRDLLALPPITTDPTTPIGMVRLLATDLDPVAPLLEDAQIGALITAEGGNAKLAAAATLEVIARSELLVAKKITTQDLSSDGPAVAAELRAQAKSLRDQVARADADNDEVGAQGLLPVWSFPPPAAWGDDYL